MNAAPRLLTLVLAAMGLLWAQRSARAPAGAPRRRLRVVLWASLAVAAAAGFAAIERADFIARRDDLLAWLRYLQEETRNLEAVAAQLAEFKANASKAEGPMAALRLNIPEKPQLDEWRAQLEPCARWYGVRMARFSEKGAWNRFESKPWSVRVQTLTVTLEGPAAGAEGFLLAVEQEACSPRLAFVAERSRRSGTTAATISVLFSDARPALAPLAWPPSGAATSATAGPWLPPLRRELDAKQREVDAAGRRLRGLESLRLAVARFHDDELWWRNLYGTWEAFESLRDPDKAIQQAAATGTPEALHELARRYFALESDVGRRCIERAVELALARHEAQDGQPPLARLTLANDVTHISDPLRDDGTPDYPAWLDRKYGAGVTRENNAAAQLREGLDGDTLRRLGLDPERPPELLQLLGDSDLELLEEALQRRPGGAVRQLGKAPFSKSFWEQRRRAHLAPWREADAPLIAAWLELNEGTLGKIGALTRHRTRYFIPIPPGLSLDTRMSTLAPLRSIGNALRARAQARIAAGDLEGARHDVGTGLRLAALLKQSAWLVDHLIAHVLLGLAGEPVVVLASASSDKAQARALLEELRGIPAPVPLADVVAVNERVMLLAGYVDLYRAARSSPTHWKERLATVLSVYERMSVSVGLRPPAPGLAHVPPWAIDWDELLRTINRCWQRGCESTFSTARKDLEPQALDSLVAKARTEAAARRKLAVAFLAGLQPPERIDRAHVTFNESAVERRLALATVALKLWSLENGRYPENAGVLATGSITPGFDPRAAHAGFRFGYHAAADGGRFAYTATPLTVGETGHRGFCADSSGRLAQTDDGGEPRVVDGLCDLKLRTLAARTYAGS